MIGGNTTARVEACTVAKNGIGETVKTWTPVGRLTGWLDMQGGSKGYQTFSAPVEETTHVFLSDYNASVAASVHKDCRAIIDGARYDVLLIDDPMKMHRQLEIYLKFSGGAEQ